MGKKNRSTKEQRWANRGTAPGKKSKYQQKLARREAEVARSPFKEAANDETATPPTTIAPQKPVHSPLGASWSCANDALVVQTKAFLGAGKITRENEKTFGVPPDNVDELYCFLTMRIKGKGFVVEIHYGNEQAVKGQRPWQTQEVSSLPPQAQERWKEIMDTWASSARQQGPGLDITPDFKSTFDRAATARSNGRPFASIPSFTEGQVAYLTSAHKGGANFERAKDIPLGPKPDNADSLYCFLSLIYRKKELVLERHTGDESALSGETQWTTQNAGSFPVTSHNALVNKMRTWDHFTTLAFKNKIPVENWPPEQSSPTPSTTQDPETPGRN